MKERILLVDGHNLLFQMFFGMPARITNHEGKAIQGTLGFVGALLKIIKLVKPTHLLVVFDGEHENFRVEMDANYKANRIDYDQVPEEENPFSQLEDIYKALDYLGIKYLETSTCEADDVIAGYVFTYGADYEMVISSFDSDFFQLLSENVSVLRYRGEKTVLCTPAFLMEKLDVSPAQYADYKSLVGDTADNIKGVSKIGPKTAALLLKEYGTLETILEHANEISKKSVRDSILESIQQAKRNYELIRLKPMDKLPFAVDEFKYYDKGIKTNEVLVGIHLKK